MKKSLVSIIAVLISIICLHDPANAQQYKLRQATNLMGMKMESTIYVKAMRKRTESPGMMGMGARTTIEQCDLQRTIVLNDKKKLYFIEPFAKQNEEVIEDDNSKKMPPVKEKIAVNEKGGVINMWYTITDTAERKKMFGLTARHIWTSQKIKPSPDACSMKDSIIMKTDGWYVDLPQFNCPVQYRPAPQPNAVQKTECTDRFVTHVRGKGKIGFPLTVTTTIIMGGGANEMQTSVETLDFVATKLDSMLFEIPQGYQLAASESELQDKVNVKEMMKNAMNNQNINHAVNNETKKPGIIRIGVFAPSGDDKLQPAALQQHVIETLNSGNIEAIAVSNEEEASKYKCDYTLTSVFTNIKSTNKIGGLLKAIKKADPDAASTFSIQGNLTLKALADGSVRSQPTIDGKYEGTINDAASKALNDACKMVVKEIK